MKDLISVVVPVYNVAAYLPQCLDSVLAQDHANLEVILIDDGATDDSGAICDRYAARDSRVQVIHQKNAGAAAAKNAGLRIASGQYLSFVDSDDYLEPNVYGYMLEVLKSENADAAQFAFRDVYRTHTEDQVLHSGRTVLTGTAYLEQFTGDWTCALLWNKLYRRDIFDGVFFEEGHKIDDEYFTYQGFLKDRRVVRDEKIIYNYRKRASGVMASSGAAQQRVMDCIDSIAKRRQKVISCHPQLRRHFDENYLDAMWYLSGNVGNGRESIEVLKVHLKRYLKTPGNSRPPRYLWGKLLRLLVTDTDKLVRDCCARRVNYNTEDYFA